MRALLLLTLLWLAAGEVLAAQPDGLYLMTRMIPGSSLQLGAWYFKNGQVTSHPSGSLSTFDFRQHAAQFPDKTGTYQIAGDKMTIQWSNGKQSTGRYEPSDHNCFYWDMGSFCPAEPFKPGTRLSGVFEGGASAGYGSVANVTKITFSTDGTYKLEGVGTASSQTDQSRFFAGGSGSQSGTYELSGTTLTLNNGGKVTQVVAFPYDDGSKGPQPRRMLFNGIMLKHIQ